MHPLLSLAIQHDQDIVAARRHAAQIAALLEFDVLDQTRIATAVAEIARNAFRYATGGTVVFELDGLSHPQLLVVRIEDLGPGIPQLADLVAGKYQSATGMGLGIAGARRLMDRFSIESSSAGTRVLLAKSLPARAPFVTDPRAEEIAAAARQRAPRGLLEEVQQQNQELLRALDDLQHKQQELARLNRELEDTNRGVVALYAELDQKADYLRRADDLKSRFLSNMTHEFRTPVNAIIGLCNLLREDREQAGGQPEPELNFILKAADQLSTLVNDLLDLAKMEAGRSEVRSASLVVQNLFGALRGMLRPLLLTQSVALVFEDADDLPAIHTDEAKVSQILRNLISNALKFTERGEVRVSASFDAAEGTITFRVADTGIGIAHENHAVIFEEFGQVQHPLQGKFRGTGLGLPLSRRLAELLGGTLTLESEPGVGSVFSVTLPALYRGGAMAAPPPSWVLEPRKLPLLVIGDGPEPPFPYETIVEQSRFQPLLARTAGDAETALQQIAPAAIVMDFAADSDEMWGLLIRLKRDDRTRLIPVLVVSVPAAQNKALALGADGFLLKPVDGGTLVETLDRLRSRMQGAIRVLVIDDQPVARHLLRQCLPPPGFEVTDAADGADGLQRARTETPHVIVLDLVMPGLPGQEVLAELRRDPLTRDIPVVVATAALLSDAERVELKQHTSAILAKGELSRHTLPDILRATLGRTI
jgi:signal transduction histidine kinase/CheY-like chemotaxis protein